MRKGIAVSPGVAVGRAYCIDEIFVGPEAELLDEDRVLAELARYERARDETSKDLNALHQKVSRQVGAKEAAIFLAHESILRDQAFTSKIRGWIVKERQGAQAALRRLLDEYTTLFSRTKDEYRSEEHTSELQSH